MEAASSLGAGERRSPHWLRPPGVQKRAKAAASEPPRSLRAASKSAERSAAASRRPGRPELPALGAAAWRSSLPSLLLRFACSLAAAIDDNQHCSRSGARAGPYDHMSSFGVDGCELVELVALAKGTDCGGLGQAAAACRACLLLSLSVDVSANARAVWLAPRGSRTLLVWIVPLVHATSIQ